MGRTAPTPPDTDPDEGYSFAGWAKDGDNTTLYTSEAVDGMTIDDDTTFTANWTCTSFKVDNKDPDSGTGNGNGTVDVYYNHSLVATLDPLEYVYIPYVSGVDTVHCVANPDFGYGFKQWLEVGTPDTNPARDFDIPVNDCPMVVGIHPHWQAIHTVYFDSNGGSPVSSESVAHNALVPEPEEPTWSGYTFDGWFENENPFTDEWNFAMDTMPKP